MENKAFGLFCVMVRVQNVLCSFFVCQILYEKRRCFGISSNVHQINEEIRDSEIRLISATGEQLGIMSAAQAQHIADEQGLDLVTFYIFHLHLPCLPKKRLASEALRLSQSMLFDFFKPNALR